MELLFATANVHKLEEIRLILPRHKILFPDSSGIRYEAEEIGSTYLENALIKARALHLLAAGLPVLSDDSGLTVPALGGAPGIRSSRYGMEDSGRQLEAGERNAYLLRRMAHLEGGERDAFFVCCMVLMLDEHRVFTVQETFHGRISAEPSGAGGFGYDPVFHLPKRNATVAELPEGEKNRISHRGRAGRRIGVLLDDLEKVL